MAKVIDNFKVGKHLIIVLDNIEKYFNKIEIEGTLYDATIAYDTLRLPTARTGRCPRNRRPRTTNSKNRIKSNNRKVFTPSGYIPAINSPLRTSQEGGALFSATVTR